MKKSLNRIGNYLNAILKRLAKWKSNLKERMERRLTFKGLTIKTRMFQLTVHDPKERPRWIGPVDKFIVEHFNN